jgi:hypothetical protein
MNGLNIQQITINLIVIDPIICVKQNKVNKEVSIIGHIVRLEIGSKNKKRDNCLQNIAREKRYWSLKHWEMGEMSIKVGDGGMSLLYRPPPPKRHHMIKTVYVPHPLAL